MPNVNDATTKTEPTEDKVTQADEGADQLEGFAEALAGTPFEAKERGEAKETEAVDTSEGEDQPKDEKESPDPDEDAADADKAEADADEGKDKDDESEGDDEPEQPVNFDGFSDSQKTTWERLYKEGHVSAEEVEENRLNTMFHSAFTKKTMALAEERKSFQSEMEERKDDLALLDKIRGDDQLHAAWLRMSQGDYTAGSGDDVSDDDLVDAKSAAKIADERYEARERERRERTSKEQAQYNAKMEEMRGAVQEWIQTLGVTPQVMEEYLQAEEKTLPADTDPILHFDVPDLHHRVMLRHEAAVAKAKAAKLEKRLKQKTSKEARASKQSSPPVRRVADKGPDDPWLSALADLNLTQEDWGKVAGSGFQGDR